VITLTREEAQQVLDALVSSTGELHLRLASPTDMQLVNNKKAIETLRARLAQSEPEPVAWYYAGSDVECASVALDADLDDAQKANCTPLYTAPPQPEPYRQQAEAVFAETNGRMTIDPVTGNVGIGWASQPEKNGGE
jgi:hypothetical protein